MRAGKLKSAIKIEREKATVNATGYKVSAWTIIATVRAERVQRSADEAATGYGEAETEGVIFRTRFFTGLTTADRIRHLGRVYNVKSIAELGIRAGLEIRAEAIE